MNGWCRSMVTAVPVLSYSHHCCLPLEVENQVRVEIIRHDEPIAFLFKGFSIANYASRHRLTGVLARTGDRTPVQGSSSFFGGID